MVQPVNQSILNQIANPGAQGFANLTNVLQNRRARQDQNKLNQLQSMAQYGPIAAGVVEQALSTPDLAARDQIMEQNRQLFEGIGVRFDDKPGTFDNNSLNTLRKGLQAYIPQQQDINKIDQVQSSSQLPGGLVQLVYKSGRVETKPANEADAELIKQAENRGVDLQGQRSQERQLLKDSAKNAADAFKQSRTIKGNINNLRNVIKAVGDGAETGPLAKRLPSMRAASIRLDNIRNRLGLDVIGSVTFGALSEGELNLALDTALPTGLEGPELVKWAQSKIDAQEKLANYMEKQAVFLSKRGNTVADWIETQQAQQPEQAARQPAQPAVEPNIDDLVNKYAD